MKQRILKGLGAASLAVALATTATLAGGKTTFTTLGVPDAYPWAMNADGTKIVGSIGYGEYFYWTANEGVVPIGQTGNAGRVVVSGDGNVIAATIFDENGYGVAGKWLGGTDWQALESLPGAVNCDQSVASAWGIDYYGQTLVGLGWLPQICRANAVSWDLVNGGPATDLGTLVPGRASRANGISGDGRIIVGWQDDEIGQRAGARWVDGVESLILTPAGESVGEVAATNYDGSVMAGSSLPYGNQRVAWVYTTKKGFKGIDSGPVYSFNVATAVNADGTVVGGLAREQSAGRARAWVFKNNSLIWLTDYVNNKKKIAPGWIILDVSGVSDDGTTITGTGVNPSGFLEGYVINNF